MQTEHFLKHANKAIKNKKFAEAKEALSMIEPSAQSQPAYQKIQEIILKDESEKTKKLISLLRNNQIDKSIQLCEYYLKQHGSSLHFLNFLGAAYLRAGKLIDAKQAYIQIPERYGYFPEVFINLGILHRHLGELDKACDYFHAVLKQDPKNKNAEYGLSFTYLLRGDYKQGWQFYESRFHTDFSTTRPKNFSGPIWDGSPLSGKTILIHCEQGFGDTIQFVRFFKNVKKLGGYIIFLCQPALKKLIQESQLADEVISNNDTLPKYDVHASLLSLPRILEIDLNDVKIEESYISTHQKTKLKDHSNALKVGFAWTGSDTFIHNHFRSMQYQDIKPLLCVENVNFYSLQVSPDQSKITNVLENSTVIDLGSTFKDFTDTAAAINELDLVITTDTSIAHLSAALGKNTWIMLHYMPDFRWLLERNDSPWYPSVKLFRQKELGNWSELLSRVIASLESLLVER